MYEISATSLKRALKLLAQCARSCLDFIECIYACFFLVTYPGVHLSSARCVMCAGIKDLCGVFLLNTLFFFV